MILNSETIGNPPLKQIFEIKSKLTGAKKCKIGQPKISFTDMISGRVPIRVRGPQVPAPEDT